MVIGARLTMLRLPDRKHHPLNDAFALDARVEGNDLIVPDGAASYVRYPCKTPDAARATLDKLNAALEQITAGQVF